MVKEAASESEAVKERAKRSIQRENKRMQILSSSSFGLIFLLQIKLPL